MIVIILVLMYAGLDLYQIITYSNSTYITSFDEEAYEESQLLVVTGNTYAYENITNAFYIDFNVAFGILDAKYNPIPNLNSYFDFRVRSTAHNRIRNKTQIPGINY